MIPDWFLIEHINDQKYFIILNTEFLSWTFSSKTNFLSQFAVQLYCLQSTPVIGQTGLITDSQHQTISGLEYTESSLFLLFILDPCQCPALS